MLYSKKFKVKNMVFNYQIEKIITKDIPSLNDREEFENQILEREDTIRIFSDDPALRYSREYYPNGLGTRKFNELCKMNFGFDDNYTVAAYSTDRKGKVLRVWANKYIKHSPEGDLVSETVFFPPKLGKRSIKYYSKDGKTYLESLKESLTKGWDVTST